MISSKYSNAYQHIHLVSETSPTYNVEGVGNPEANEIPCPPLATLRLHCDLVNCCTGFYPTGLLLTRLQIKIVQHQLGIGQAWFRRNSYLVREVREPGIF